MGCSNGFIIAFIAEMSNVCLSLIFVYIALDCTYFSCLLCISAVDYLYFIPVQLVWRTLNFIVHVQ